MKKQFNLLKRRAYRKKLEISITYQDFIRLKNNSCEYCGVEKYLLPTYCEKLGIKTPYMTIDRKDNKLGYTKDNTVSCCFVCNRIKNNVFNYEEMKDIAEKHLVPKIKALEPEVWDTFEMYLPDADL